MQPPVAYDLSSPAEWARRLAVGTAGGLFLGAVGGFGTFVETTLPERMAAWLVMFWAGTVIYSLLVGPAMLYGRRWGAPLWACVAVPVVAGAVPMTQVTFLATTQIMHVGMRQPWLERYWQVLIVTAPILGGYVFIRALMQRRPTGALPDPHPPLPAEPQARPAPFLARLPARLGRDLQCLEMEDHYVRAHTALGSDLILMRMRDAVAELDGVEGMQVHRSWWVARAALAEVLRDNGTMRLKLRNGLVVPVARRVSTEVKAAGW